MKFPPNILLHEFNYTLFVWAGKLAELHVNLMDEFEVGQGQDECARQG